MPPVLQAIGKGAGMGQGIHSQQLERARLRGRKVGSETGSEVSIGEREGAKGLEKPAVVPMAKGGLEPQFHHRPHPAGAGERIDQVHYAIGPIVKVQQIKNLLPELGENIDTHTLIMPHFWNCRKHSLSISEVSPKSRKYGRGENRGQEVNDGTAKHGEELLEWAKAHPNCTLRALKEGVRQWKTRMGRQLLEEALTMQGEGKPPEDSCSCGRRWGLEGYRPRNVMTSQGLIQVKRAYFTCERCGQGFPPWTRRKGFGRDGVRKVWSWFFGRPKR